MTGIRKGLASAILLLFAAFSFSQQPHFVLNSETTGSTKNYTAWDFVSFKPGFHYVANSGSGHTFSAKTQPGPPSTPTSNSYMSETGVISSDPAQGGVVGTIPGHVDVSGSGAATYSIPIEVPSGIQGMTPSLSFSYNSNGGDGTMGIGWDLSGLSMISRSGSILFKDRGRISTWINDSIFYLDGVKLIAKDKVYPTIKTGIVAEGEEEYRYDGMYDGEQWENFETEYKSYSKISTFGYIPFVSTYLNTFSASCSAPRTFVVTSKDGRVSSYQAAKDLSYINKAEDINVEWLLVHSSDPQGNFINYQYLTIGKQTVIKKIEYTGNNQKEPFDSLVFEYDNKETIDRYYVSDATLENRLLLKCVKAYSGNIVLRQYDLDYSKVGAKYYLQSVALKGLENAHFRKTIFSWGPNYDDLETQTFAIPDVSSEYPVSNYSRTWYAADINGDGLDDVVNIYPAQVLNNGVLISKDFAQVYKSTQTAGDITLTSEASFDLGYSNGTYSAIPDSDVLFGDINGDGKEEMLFPNVNTTTLTLTVSVMGIGSITRNLGTAGLRPLFCVGDINKDGKEDFIYLESSPRSDGKYYGGVLLFTQGTAGTWISISQTTKPRRILISDLNNDGLNDILMVGANQINALVNNKDIPNESFFENKTVFSSLPNSVCKLGDFNGDGATDYLIKRSDDSTWHVFFNKGQFTSKDSIMSNITAQKNAIEDSNIFEENCIILDFNNDGKSDLVVIDDVYDSNNIHLYKSIIWYSSNGNGFDQIKELSSSDPNYILTRHRCVGDFNGDGREDLISIGSELYNGTSTDNLVHFTNSFDPSFGSNLLKSIRDGFGNTTQIAYRPLTNTLTSNGRQFYTKGINTVYPNMDLQAPFKCVEKISSSDGLGGENATEFTYGEAIANLTGKGFLGFKQFQRSNASRGQKSISTTDWNLQCYQPNVQTTELLTIGGTQISKNETYFSNVKTDSFIISRPYKNVSIDPLNQLTQTSEILQFDDYGNPLQKRTTIGDLITTETIKYTSKGCLYPSKPKSIELSSQLGSDTKTRKSIITYDDSGRLIKTERDSGNVNQMTIEYKHFNYYGLPTCTYTTTNGKTLRDSAIYSSSDRFMVSHIDELGQTTTNNWDETTGRLLSSTNRIGTTYYHYDGLGRLWKTDYPDGTSSIDVLQWASQNNFSAKYYRYQAETGSAPAYNWYDALGRGIVSETYLLGGKKSRTFTEYLASGQLSRVSRPTFSDQPDAWDATYSYYPDGRVNTISTPLGNTTYSYNGTATTQMTPKGTSVVTINNYGKVLTSTTNGKSVTFDYYASGLTKSATPQGGQAVTMEYDLQGNRTKLTDPDAGISTASYNGFGQPVWEKMTNNAQQGEITTRYAYLPGGQLDTLNRNGEITKYEYDNLLRIKSVTVAGKHKQSYGYDAFDRDTCLVEEIDGRVYRKSYAYDAVGRLAAMTYPSSYKSIYNYDTYGNLTGVTDTQSRNIMTLLDMNARGQGTKVSRGVKQTTFGYDATKGLLTSMATPGVSSYNFEYDGVTNNLSSRKDVLTNQEYRFVYDTKDRLTNWNIYQNGIQTKTNSQEYDDAGNIQSRTDLETLTMTYGANGKPHALASISGTPGAIPLDSLGVSYTDFRKIATLVEGSRTYELTYGVDNQRRKSVYKIGGVTKSTRYYLGDYEEEITPAGIVRKIHYLSGGAILIRNNNVDTLLYAYSDNQGSLTALTNEAGTVVERYAYDPWGRRLNPSDWKAPDTRTTWMTNRGYTGHEHLDAFGIINMNGRVYDPATAMFLSPDPFIQQPGNWVNYNRYGYCMNNPTNATDPSGYEAAFIDSETDAVGRNWYNAYTEAMLGGFSGGGGAGAFFKAYSESPSTAMAWANANAHGYKGHYDTFKANYNSTTRTVRHYLTKPGEIKILRYEKEILNGHEVSRPVIGISNEVIGERFVSYENGSPTGQGGNNFADYTELVGDIGGPIGSGAKKILDNRGAYMPRGQIYKMNKPVTVRTPVVNINTTSKVLNYARLGGKVLVVGGVVATGYQVGSDISNGDYYSAGARAAVFGVAAGAAFIPVVGWGVTIGIGVADFIWGDQFYNYVETRMGD